MTHFVGIVVGDNIEGQLAHYDENMEVERYRDFIDPEPKVHFEGTEPRRAWPYSLVEEEAPEVDLSDPQAVADWCNARWPEDDAGEHYEVHEGRLFRWSTYNPASKWDWYSVGGRWEDWCRQQGFEPATSVAAVPWDTLEYLPSIVVAEGAWAEGKDWGWWGTFTPTADPDEWDRRWREFFAKAVAANPDLRITFVDFHI